MLLMTENEANDEKLRKTKETNSNSKMADQLGRQWARLVAWLVNNLTRTLFTRCPCLCGCSGSRENRTLLGAGQVNYQQSVAKSQGRGMRREAGAKWQEASGKRQEPTVGKSRKACARHNYEAIRRNYYLGHPTQGAGGVFGAGADAGAGAPWNIWPVLGPLVRPFGGRAKRMRTSLSFMVQRTRAAE